MGAFWPRADSFHLYVPASAVEIARRLCVENQVNVAELWSFHSIGDQTRFTLVQRSAGAASRERSVPEPRRPAPAEPARSVKPAADSGRPHAGAGASRAARPAAARKRQPAPRAAKARPARPKAGRSQAGTGAKKEVSTASPALRPGSPRLRNDVARSYGAKTWTRAASHPLLVPHAAGGPRRPRGNRRGRDSSPRAAQSRRPVRLDANSQTAV